MTASLTQLGVQVTQFVRDALVFATLQAPPLSEALHERYREHGVDLQLGATEIPPAPTSSLRDRRRAERRARRGRRSRGPQRIVVNERFETSKPGVYAVGDVAEFFDPLFGRHRRIEHWSNAAYHGTTLGRILAGEDARYDIVSSSSRSSSAARSSRSATRRATTRPRSRATSARTAPSSGSSATARQ